MAGYTSRFFLTLTIPSVFGFFSVLWFLKRKSPSKSVSKAIQVEEEPSSEDFENQFLTLNPMKLKSEEVSCEGNVSSEMQLKETQTSQSQNANGIQQNGKVKGKKKSKSKSRENSSTCPKDTLTNGNDKHHSLEDNGIELAYGIEAIDLNKNVSAKDEILVHANNKTNSEMEITNDTNSLQTNVKINGTDKETSVTTDTERSTNHQNVESAKELCDRDAQVSTERNSSVDEKKIEQSDTHEPLTLPVDCTEIPGEMLESPGATYCDSVGSSDSGKGPSENQFETYQGNLATDVRVYEFDILQELVGLLIGRNGRHVRYIKEQTNANILIKRHPYFCHKKICAVTGTDDEIHAALKMIRKRFPAETYPTVTLSQITLMPFNVQQCLDISPLSIPEGVSFEAMLCATVNAGHFFLQQPTHPTFHSLPALTSKMSAVYSQDINAPPLSHIDKGFICAAKIGGGWFRAEIDEVFDETDECRLKFLDYGGYAVVPRATLKQIRIDFMCVPFQATECYLGSVTVPDGETEWSPEATAAFEELAQGQIVQGYVVGYHEDKVPFVNLYKVTGASSIFINRELVSRGLAKWIASDME